MKHLASVEVLKFKDGDTTVYVDFAGKPREVHAVTSVCMRANAEPSEVAQKFDDLARLIRTVNDLPPKV